MRENEVEIRGERGQKGGMDTPEGEVRGQKVEKRGPGKDYGDGRMEERVREKRKGLVEV